MSAPKKIENPQWARAAGKVTLLKLEWKSWKKELPKSGDEIYVIVKFRDGYLPVMGTYIDEVIPANGPFKASRWRTVRMHPGELILENKDDAKRLIAWARAKIHGDSFTKI